MKRTALIFITVLMIISIFTGCGEAKTDYVYAPDFEVKSQSAYLVNMDTDTLVYESNQDKLVYPSTLTQMVTAVLAIEETSDLDAKNITISAELAEKYKDKSVPTASFAEGETYSMRELLSIMLMTSAYDAADAIAQHLSNGNEDAFVERMNAKAKSIGTAYTNFINPTGADNNNQYTTAKDMYLIAKYCANIPVFNELLNQKSFTVPAVEKTEETPARAERIITNINPMLTEDSASVYYNSDIISLGSGHSIESGDSYVSLSSNGSEKFLLVLMGSPVLDNAVSAGSERPSMTEAISMFAWAFKTVSYSSPTDKDKSFAAITVPEGFAPAQLSVVSKKNFKSYLPDKLSASDVKIAVKTIRNITEPINKGDMIGVAEIISNNQIVSEFPLYAGNSVYLSTSANKFKIPAAVKVILIIVVVLIVLVLVIRAINVSRYKKKRRRRMALAQKGSNHRPVNRTKR